MEVMSVIEMVVDEQVDGKVGVEVRKHSESILCLLETLVSSQPDCPSPVMGNLPS